MADLADTENERLRAAVAQKEFFVERLEEAIEVILDDNNLSGRVKDSLVDVIHAVASLIHAQAGR